MQCHIYKASTRDELYVYIASAVGQNDNERLNSLPSTLRNSFGRATYVMQLELSSNKKLARVPVQSVLDALDKQGYFVQFPPDGLISPNAVEPEGLRGA